MDVSNYNLSNLFPFIDILVTDYSSILFDFSIFKKNIILYIPDFNEYTKFERKLYISPSEICPGHVAYNIDSLIELLNLDNCIGNQLYENYMSACDGYSCQKIYNFLLGETHE